MASQRKTKTKWSVEYDTCRRQKLFHQAPKDHTAWPALRDAVKPHIESFNALFDERLIDAGLQDIGIHTVVDGDPRSSNIAEANRLDLRITAIELERSVLPASNKFSTRNREIFPAECRERHASYRGKLRAKLQWRVNDEEWRESVREIGQMPIMLKSNRCHLEKLSPAELVARKEDSEEVGGYFIVNGNEKLIRMLIVPRRNYPTALARSAFSARGPTFSKFGISIRSLRPDQTSQTNVLHYLTDGNVTFRFSWRKAEYLVPVMMILKALVETNDREICNGILGTSSKKATPNSFVADRVELLLRTYKAYDLKTRKQTLSYLGKHFAPVVQTPPTMSPQNVGREFLRKIVLPHLGNKDVTETQNYDKFQLMLFMIRKLYAFAAGDCAADNPDAVSNQEVLLGGFIYGMILKESLAEWLGAIGATAREWARSKNNAKFTDASFNTDFLPKVVRRTTENIAQKLEYFLSTGNLVSQTGLDLQQTNGFSVMAEKINFYRFISHFRCIHRGSFFAQLKTTTVRKLLPESWGFLCPVHTPDGAPCGLLNHLAHQCYVQIQKPDTSVLEEELAKFDLEPHPGMDVSQSLAVQLDGRIIGFCQAKKVGEIAQLLRHWKVSQEVDIPLEIEIGYVAPSNGGLYPGLYLFSGPSRMLRPVKYLPLNKIDFVGPFEQQYMHIACLSTDIIPSVTTHVEIKPTNIFSILANMTPFSDYNQSPRNMYQCQMAKQAMGTPSTSLMYRTDNKAYLLHTGQTPIARPPLYNAYGLDNYPNGLNAVVAVISYTGYDMDDAMIINKASHERGLGDGCIYKTVLYDIAPKSRGSSKTDIRMLFGYAEGDTSIPPEALATLDSDGLPQIGTKITEGSHILAKHTVMLDPESGKLVNHDRRTVYVRYKDAEAAYIDQVRLLGTETGDTPCQAISVKYRIPRRPVIGDKFASRHGQKGVCSFLWPSQDMPFSESGIQPDIIINPHAFPSRMTIGMFIESLAGKSGALHGLAQDSTPFSFRDEPGLTAGDFFGDQLLKAGYNFFGNEPMYSGITGKEFAADIYLGVVYYQRLRHMVSDKFQVRSTGPVNKLTGQPIKGRSRGGGIRVGEMERDSLIAHGCAFLLQDRLMDCSDKQRAWICRQCGMFVGTQMSLNRFEMTHSTSNVNGALTRRAPLAQPSGVVRCRNCARQAQFEDSSMSIWEDGEGRRFVGGEDVTVISVPGVLRYLDVELAAMGIKMKFKIEG